MQPLLRENQYGAALLQISFQIASTIAEDRGVSLTPGAPAPAEAPAPSFFGIPPALLNLLILLLIFGGWRLLAFLLAVGGLSRYRRGGGYRGGWIGPMSGWGGGYGGSSGGGGFGGFGGGTSGGGGASGSW